MKAITAEYFTARVGSPPQQDDLERCNCPKAGQPMHSGCGWSSEHDLPMFMCPSSPESRGFGKDGAL